MTKSVSGILTETAHVGLCTLYRCFTRLLSIFTRPQRLQDVHMLSFDVRALNQLSA